MHGGRMGPGLAGAHSAQRLLEGAGVVGRGLWGVAEAKCALAVLDRTRSAGIRNSASLSLAAMQTRAPPGSAHQGLQVAL